MDFIGRIGYYKGDCVEILDCDEERKVSKVRRLSLPNTPELEETLWVKISSLKFASSTSFVKRFPDAISQRGSYDPVSKLSDGSHLDFSDCVLTEGMAMDRSDLKPFQIESSCKFTGKGVVGVGKVVSLATRLPVPVKIWVKVNDIVEFEDLNLSTSVPCGVRCFSGENIVFRRCSFTSKKIGACVLHGRRTGLTSGALQVSFEKCSFLDCAESGLQVGAGGNVLLLDCTFERCGVGLQVLHGGNVALKHCSFLDCTTGVVVGGRRSTADVLNCVFSKMSMNGIALFNGGRLDFHGCRVTDCKATGIVFEGPKRSFGCVSNTVIAGCKYGIIIQYGKIDVTLTTSEFSKNRVGIYLQIDAIGYVDICGCDIAEETSSAVYDYRGPLLALTIDGVTTPGKSVAYLKEEIVGSWNVDGGLLNLRLIKNAGLGEMRCYHCHILEPDDVMFKKCGQCKNACYCSRACQVT